MMKRLLIVLILVVLGAGTLAATSRTVRDAAKRHTKWAVVATHVYQEGLRRWGIRSDQIDQDTGETRTTAAIPRTLHGINQTFANYLSYLPSGESWLEHKHVLELGPGDNLGVALRFIGAGADRVLALDKFVPLRDTAFHRALYSALREERPEQERRAIDQAIDLSQGMTLHPERLAWLSGVGVEEAHASMPAKSFDLIVSNAVLEEIYDIDTAFDGMDRVLRPGGYEIHKIDLRDYGTFTRHGYHPLEYLTIPDGIYRYMAESTGLPNRRLVDYYRAKAAALGYVAHIYTTLPLGATEELRVPKEHICPCDQMTQAHKLIQDIRPRLLPRYQQLSDDDLIVRGIIFVAQKPVAALDHQELVSTQASTGAAR